MESMRTPFFDDSRVMLVLYRNDWGKTRWTQVEERAIKDACFEGRWQRLFFLVLDSASPLPIWLPPTYVWFNYVNFGLEEAVGAIKVRVQENGGQYLPLTAMKRLELYKADELYRVDKSLMSSSEGLKSIACKVLELFQQIEAQCAKIASDNTLQIRVGVDFKERNSNQTCVITDGRVGLIVAWYRRYPNLLDNSGLTVTEYNGGLIVPGELGQRVHLNTPKLIRQQRYQPELSLAREYGWKEEGANAFMSSSALAEQCVIQFIDLVSRRDNGEIDSGAFV